MSDKIISVKLDGYIEVMKMFNDLKQSQIASRVVKLTANFLETTAKKNLKTVVYSRFVPWKRTKKLQQSVVNQVINENSSRVYVGVDYGHFVEEGTKPHIIRPRPGKKFLAIPLWGAKSSLKTQKVTRKISKFIFVKQVNHPGTKPYPFFAPAIESTKTEIPFIWQKEIGKKLKL